MNWQSMVLPCALALVACATVSPERIASMKADELCASYSTLRSDPGLAAQVRKEIERRGLIAAADWSSIDRGSIRVGMPVCALYASWGSPSRENRTITGGGVSIQHVYSGYSGRYVSTRSNYAYTRNGVITAIQN